MGRSKWWSGSLVLIGVAIPLIILNHFAIASEDRAGSAAKLSSVAWDEQAKLLASDGDAQDWFGHSVAIDGDYIVVGAVGAQNSAGAAYVFVRNGAGWVEQAKLRASDAESGDAFGYSVAADGDTVLVGAARDADNGANAGSAYVFIRDGDIWIEQAKLTPTDGEAGDQFGWRVALSGDTAIAGAVGDDDVARNAGAAYVFVLEEETWVQQTKLTVSDSEAGDRFGWRVALDRDHAVVSAKTLEDMNGDFSGQVYVFRRDERSWTERAKLTPAEATAGDRFGYSVAIAEDFALVGAVGDNERGDFSGVVYAFRRSGGVWSQQAKLTASDGMAWHRFGSGVSLSGDTAVVGAVNAGGNAEGFGAAYVFVHDGAAWVQQGKLVASDGEEGYAFGNSVSVAGDTTVVGAAGDADNGDFSGAAYVYVRSGVVTPAADPTPTATLTPTVAATASTTPAAPTSTPTVTSSATATVTASGSSSYLPLITR